MTPLGTDPAGSWWQALALLAAFVLGPCLAWAATSRLRPARRGPGPLTPDLAAGVSVGMTTWVAASSLLVRIDALRPGPVWVAAATVLLLSAACVGATALVQRRRRPSGFALSDLVPDRATLGRFGREVGFPLAVAVLAALPQLVVIARRPDSLISPTSWYYWLTARAVALTGGVPESATEWGQSTESFTFHSGFSASTASLAVASGDPDALVAPQLVRIVAVLLFGLGVWCLARALGASSPTAACATVLASSVKIYAIKLSSFRPEATAYGLAFLTVALLVWGLRWRDRRLLGASVVGAIGLTQLHGLSSLLALALMAGVAVAYVLWPGGRSDSWRTRFGWTATYAVVAAVAALAAGFLLTGQWSEATATESLPDPAPDGSDPTWAFARMVSSRGALEDPGYDPPTISEMARASLDSAFLGSAGWVMPVFVVVTVAVAALVSVRRPHVRGPVVVGVVSFLALVAVGFVLSMFGPTYIPRRTGFSRVLQLWPVIPVVVIAGLAVASGTAVRRHLAAGALAAATVVIAVSAVPRIVDFGDNQPRPGDLATMQALPIAPGSTVLTNAYTQGFVSLWTPGSGLLDGHAPYLEEDLLERSNAILAETRDYFAGPRDSPFPFDEYGVDYVLAAKKPHALGTSLNFFPRRVGRLAGSPRLQLLVDTPRVVLYRVLPEG